MVCSSFILKAVLTGLGLCQTASSACSSNLLVDNYSNYANHLNSLGQYTSGEYPTGFPQAILTYCR